MRSYFRSVLYASTSQDARVEGMFGRFHFHHRVGDSNELLGRTAPGNASFFRSRGFVDDRVYHLFHRQVTVAQRDVEFIQNHE